MFVCLGVDYPSITGLSWGFIPKAVEWNHKSTTAIFSQPKFLTTFEQLFSKMKPEREKPRGLGVVKC